MLSDIGRLLDRDAIGDNARDNALHEFKLGDVPIIDQVILLAMASTSINDGILVGMECIEGRLNFGTHRLIDGCCLCSITEIHQRVNGNQKIA